MVRGGTVRRVPPRGLLLKLARVDPHSFMRMMIAAFDGDRALLGSVLKSKTRNIELHAMFDPAHTLDERVLNNANNYKQKCLRDLQDRVLTCNVGKVHHRHYARHFYKPGKLSFWLQLGFERHIRTRNARVAGF